MAASGQQDQPRGSRDDGARHRARPPKRSAMTTAPRPTSLSRTLPSDDARAASDRRPAGSRCPRVCRGGMFAALAWRSCCPAAWTSRNTCARDRGGARRAATHPDSTDDTRYATVIWPISLILHGRIEASQGWCTEEEMMRTPVRSIVVMALALLARQAVRLEKPRTNGVMQPFIRR